MKVLSTNPDGTALVQFGNLRQYGRVVGETEPIQAVVGIAQIPDLLRIGQQARRSAQQLSSMFAVFRREQ